MYSQPSWRLLMFPQQGCFSMPALSSLRQDAVVSILVSLQVGKVEVVATLIFQGFLNGLDTRLSCSPQSRE